MARNVTKFRKVLLTIIVIIIVANVGSQIHAQGIADISSDRSELDSLRDLAGEIYEEVAQYLRMPPTDEEMITHFRKHRADFELLAQIYRQVERERDGFGKVESMDNIKTIMKRINVNRVSGTRGIWMGPDPYALKSSRQTGESTPVQEDVTGDGKGLRLHGVVFDYAHKTVRRNDNVSSRVHKGFYYTPFVPKTGLGSLVIPNGSMNLFPDLNEYPSKLLPTLCVYRQFEPQWFIRLCQ